MNKLIVNADDYGLGKLFNAGIIELAQAGIVTSISVMIKRQPVEVKELLSLKNVSIGLHLELGNNSEAREIENQIELFSEKFGKLPSHLDGHQHCHLTADNIENVISVAKKYNLPVRSKSIVDRLLLTKNQLKTPDNFISWHPKRAKEMLSALENETARVCELVCHPGYYDKNADVLYNESREKELEFLKSDAFENISKKFEKISYNEI